MKGAIHGHRQVLAVGFGQSLLILAGLLFLLQKQWAVRSDPQGHPDLLYWACLPLCTSASSSRKWG